MKRLLLIDTFNLLHRAYHALPTTFKDINGEPTNAVYGVTSMLINVLNEIKPSYVVAALDSMEPTFRIEDFTAYKAHRKPMEEALSSQIPKVFEILSSFGIKQITVNGYEADDIIAALSLRFREEVEVIILSNDRDLWQLANKNVFLMVPNTKGASEWLGASEVEKRLGFSPSLVPDYKGLRGDPSDNIPGVFGIGEKTATTLIQKYGSMEDIYRNIESVTPATLKEKLLNSYETALLSKKLAQVIYDVPFSVTLDECKYTDFNKIQVKNILERYNFKSLIRRLGFEDTSNSKSKSSSKKEQDNSAQMSFF